MKLSDIKYSCNSDIVKTKVDGVERVYDLIDPAERRLYFNAKVGDEIVKLREYFQKNSFVAYFLAPKMAGKGTYTKMLAEILGEELFEHVSVGDVVRAAHEEFEEHGKDSKVYEYVKKNYRGLLSLEDAFNALLGRSTKNLLPTEFVLTLIKREIDRLGGKTIFLDGFPRKVGQVSYSLYFRDLINYRNDPDVFLLINIPMGVIDARIKGRRVCPECKTSRNIQLHATSTVELVKGGNVKVGEEVNLDDVQLICDNPVCKKYKMVAKEGDEKGLELIKDRIIDNFELMKFARQMYGIQRIELYNAVKKDEARDLVDNYEITKECYYKMGVDGLETKERSFSVNEISGKDSDVEYLSLLPPPVVIQLIRQLVSFLRL